MSTDQRQGINWVQVIAAALAAVSSAVVLSTLGVAGTIIGAALGSVTASLGAAVYSRTIDASRQQVASQASALKRVAQARLQVDDAVMAMQRGGARSDTGVVLAQARLSEAEQALQDAEVHVERGAEASGPAGAPLREDLDLDTQGGGDGDALVPAEAGRRLPWKRIALVAAGVFLVAMIVISGFELITGRAVSQLTGGSDNGTGSTIPGLASGGGKTKPTPTPSSQPSQQPSVQPSEQPSTTPSSSPTSTPTTVPSPTPSLTQSPAPSASSTPSPSLPVG